MSAKIKKISINGGIGFDYTAETLREDTKKQTGDLEININSSGGSVYDAFEIYNEIMEYRKKNNAKVTMVFNGLVASAASYLAMAATERVAYDNSVFMIHNAMIGAIGDHRTMEFWSQDLEKTDRVIATAYAKASGNSIEKVLDFMSIGQDNNGTYFYGQEIIDSGFANKLIDTDIDSDKENTITESKMMVLNFNKKLSNNEYDHDKISAMISDVKLNAHNNNENIGEERMERKDILAALLVLKTNNGITLPEIAKELNLGSLLITDEQKANIAKHNSIIKLCGEADPVEFIEGLMKERKENAIAVRSAKMTESFGVEIFEDTKKANKARVYAEKVLGDAELTDEKVNEIKEDELYKQLALERSDIDSPENVIVIHEESNKINTATTKVVDY